MTERWDEDRCEWIAIGWPPKRRAQPEQALQRQVCAFLRVALPPDVWWTAIPLGGGGAMRGKVLRGTGTRAGTPDMLVVARGARPIWLELKSPKGRVSDEQRACHDHLLRAGCWVYVCRSLDDVIDALQACGVTLRAR